MLIKICNKNYLTEIRNGLGLDMWILKWQIILRDKKMTDEEHTQYVFTSSNNF